MNYLLKSKPKHTNRSKLIAVVALYAFLSLCGFFFGNSIRRAAWAASSPLWKTGSIVASPFGSMTDYFKFKNALIARNLSLEEENANLKVKELGYDALLAENENLKTELGRQPGPGKIISAILSKPPRSPYDTLVIDVGSGDGVVQGSKVFLGENLIIGLVTNITPHTSLVSLFSGGDQKQEAIVSRTGASFILLGKGGQNFQVEVPKDTDIVWGDTFVYPGLSGSVIASVYYIDTNSQSSFKTIYLRIPTNVFAAKQVFVQKAEQ